MTRGFLRVLVCTIAMTLFSSLAARADSLSVFVGYADNLRASGFFPSPWLGAANVVSQSSANQTFDSGAIRIDNTGATSITITNLSVTLNPAAGPIVYNTLWSPLIIGPGQVGIFAQNNGNDTQFDTSDHGLFGGSPPAVLEPNNADGNGNTNLIGGCSSAASFIATAGDTALCSDNAPIISFDENGNPMSFTDSGHIVDTGEWDFVNNSAFGEDGNESINWNAIGGNTRGGTPEPSTMLLFGSSLLGLGGFLRRRLRNNSRIS
jgi:PEP-CTERM motif